jgi:hypothetical protein
MSTLNSEHTVEIDWLSIMVLPLQNMVFYPDALVICDAGDLSSARVI